ncbi:MAG: hypothetical protein QOI10_2219 [Solirubrobacterales bacterium]|nr:hypothetical protein [Solirubrobacterales bacterium]
MCTCEFDQLPGPINNHSSVGSSTDGYAPTAAKLEQPLVAQRAKRPQNGVRVYTDHRGQILSRGKALSRPCFTVSDRASDLGGDLFVQSDVG